MIKRSYFYSGTVETEDKKFFCGVATVYALFVNKNKLFDGMVNRLAENFGVHKEKIYIKELNKI